MSHGEKVLTFETPEVGHLSPLMPNKMTVDRDSAGRLFYLYQRGLEDVASLGKDSQVYHVYIFPAFGRVGRYHLMAKNAVGLAIATEEYGAKFFANGAAPGGVLEHPGTIKDPQKVGIGTPPQTPTESRCLKKA